MHGGAWNYGISIEHDGVNGENLARHGDIVFCSVNHRLGPMGFSDFSAAGGEKYALSGNVGALDLVAALEWIRDNIASFGGDPGNVTIMGQSGGGAKVTTITAMPSAKGLFHKAVVLSGAGVKSGEKEYSEKLGSYVLKEAGLKIDPKEVYNPDGISLVDALVQLSGCTGSFISGKGLIITNHHCAFGVVARSSSVEKNYLENGFYASTFEEEIPATGYTCKITESYNDVSDEILRAVKDTKDPAERTKAIAKKIQELSDAASDEKESKEE